MTVELVTLSTYGSTIKLYSKNNKNESIVGYFGNLTLETLSDEDTKSFKPNQEYTISIEKLKKK